MRLPSIQVLHFFMELRHLHALVLPLPAQGHINPLLRFSHLLLLHSPTTFITLVVTQPYHLPCEAHSTRIRFLSIPDGLPPHSPSSMHASLQSFLMLAEDVRRQQPLLEDIVSASTSTPSPISCIISDSFFPWTQDMANRLHIKRVMFWTSNATTLYAEQLFVTHRIAISGDAESGDVVKVVGGETDDDLFSLLHREIVPQFIATRTQRSLEFMKEMFEGIDEAASIVVGTLQRLEGPIVKAMPVRVPVRCCAPCSTLFQAENGGLDEDQSECLRWLDKQKASSVLYISFGSVAELASEEMTEVALGIEASKQAFLWVVRHESRSERRTQGVVMGLLERTQERGKIIEWAPQRHVLSHPAVGGFLTHCGWNSSLESIAMGVPMLCWPIFAEQPLNSMLIQKVWQVGMGFAKGEKGVVGREEVEKRVVLLLQGEEGKAMRQRAHELAEEIKTGFWWKEGSELEKFMRDVSS